MGGVQDRGTRVHPWLIHVNVWQKPSQYCKVIILQLKQINLEEKKKKQGLSNNLEGWVREGDERKAQKGGDIRTPMADSC